MTEREKLVERLKALLADCTWCEGHQPKEWGAVSEAASALQAAEARATAAEAELDELQREVWKLTADALRRHHDICDQRDEALAQNEAMRMALDGLYDATWELCAALSQHPTLKLGGRLAEALEAAKQAALVEYGRRAALSVPVEERKGDMASRDHARSASALGWRTIASAPRDHTNEVLVLTDCGVVHQASWEGPSDGAVYSGSASRYNWFSRSACQSLHDLNVTHWMPLPAAPAEARSEQPEGDA